MKKYFQIVIIIGTILIIACTKYKENGFISMRSPSKRLLGNWKLVAFEVDDVDSLANLWSYAKYSNCTFNFVYDKENSKNKIEGCVNDWMNGWGISKEGFFMREYFIYPGRETGVIKLYDVIKLYKGDFWIQKIIYRKKYVIKFKKQ